MQHEQSKEWRDVSSFQKPNIPTDIFSEPYRKLIEQFHASNGCPVDYIVCVMTSTVCAAVYDRFDIQAKFKRLIPLTLYQFAVGDSGSMKSAAFSYFPAKLRWLTDHQNAIITKSNRDLDDQISDLKKQIKSADDGRKKALQSEIAKTQKMKKPLYPLIETDATLEALARAAARSNECVSLFSPEPLFINIIAGKSYASGKGATPNIDLLLKSFDAEYCRISRVGQEDDIVFSSPRMCICISGQKRALTTLTKEGEQAERGFPNRCLFYYPDPTYDHDAFQETPVDPALKEQWDSFITTLFKTNRGKGKTTIVVSEEAIHIHDDYRNRALQKAKRARYAGEIKGWLRKMADYALRFAGILALMDNPSGRTLEADHIQRAIRFFEEYALPMALIAYDITGNELSDKEAQYLQRIKQLIDKDGQCTEGRLKDYFRRDGKDFFNIISQLRERDFIHTEKIITGKKPFIVIHLNPFYKG